MTPVMHKTAVVLLLVVGVQLWLLIGRGQYGSAPRPMIFLAAVAIASLPPIYRRVARSLDRVREAVAADADAHRIRRVRHRDAADVLDGDISASRAVPEDAR